jgi:hypothetical protein
MFQKISGHYVILHHRPQMGQFLLGVLLPGVFQLWYNSAYLGGPFFQPSGEDIWSTPLMEGLGGILISPGRGLFVYSPILLNQSTEDWYTHAAALARSSAAIFSTTAVTAGSS